MYLPLLSFLDHNTLVSFWAEYIPISLHIPPAIPKLTVITLQQVFVYIA